MFSFLQQLVPKRREDIDADEDAYAESSAMPAFVPPAPLVKPPLTEEEIAEQEREAAEAEAREAEERAEAERLEREALDDEKRRAEERLVERQERARVLLEERAAERQRREEARHVAEAATLVADPESESESESESTPALGPEPIEALDAHVVEDEPPTTEEDVAHVHELAHVEEPVDDVDVPEAALEHVERTEHLDHVDHVDHEADEFAFVAPASDAEHVAHVEPVDHVADADDNLALHPPDEAVDDVALVHPVAHVDEDLAFDEHVEAFEAHAPDAEPIEPVAPVAEAAPLEPVVAHEQHVHAHVGAAHVEAAPVPEIVERFTWPATLLHHEHAMHYGEAARRNLISMIVELNDAKLARVLHDALYEERPDGLRPEVLAALQRSYNGEELRETYERFVRIGSDHEREIAREGLRSLDEGQP
jgi:hypothetical protein